MKLSIMVSKEDKKLENTLVFIDAGYLSKVLKHFGDGKYLRVDLVKFAKYISIKQNLWCSHVFYYTAPPYQSPKPTPSEKKFKTGYDSFVSKLDKHKEITIREGRLQKIGNDFTQKGVDTLLTMDLRDEPSDRDIKTIILLVCDTDFVPILNNIRKKHKIKVILYYYTDKKRKSIFSMSNHILTACDSKVLLTKEDFTKNLQGKS